VSGQLHAPAALLRVATPGNHWAPKSVWAFVGRREKSFVAVLCTDCTITSFPRHVLFEEIISRICPHKPHIQWRDCDYVRTVVSATSYLTLLEKGFT